MPTETSRRMIELVHLARNYTRADGQRVSAVDDVSLIVPEGEFVCLIGPSGCGKSTLLQMIAGLVGPSSGAIVVDGKEIDGPGRERGMVFQRDSVFPWMRVIDNVEYGLKCRGVAAGARRDIAHDYLKRVGLSHVERAWPRELSGGMLKRVAIAAVFANGGEVLLLDEPFGALDYVTRRQLQEVLLDLWEEPGRAVPTVVFVTHDVDEALLLADRIVAMRNGAIVDDIPVGAARPRDTDTLLLQDMVAIKHRLLGHLGLAHAARGAAGARGAACPTLRASSSYRFRSSQRLQSCGRFFPAFIRSRRSRASRWSPDGARCSRGLCLASPIIGRADWAWPPSPMARRAVTSRHCSPSFPIRLRHWLGSPAGLCLAAFLASLSVLPFPGRPGAAGSFNSRPSFCALCRCSQWCLCSSSGSAPISMDRSCSSPMASG